MRAKVDAAQDLPHSNPKGFLTFGKAPADGLNNSLGHTLWRVLLVLLLKEFMG